MYEIINGKSENVIPTLDNESIDLVITSPPYNVDLGNNKYNKRPYDLYNDNLDHKEYINWLEEIFKKIWFKLKKGGRVVINIGDQKNGAVATHSDIIQFMTKKLNYLLMTNIIWDKKHTSNRCSWGSYCSPSSPSFPKSFEYIMIFAKETKKLQEKGETDLTPDEFKKWAYGLWTVAPEGSAKKIGHPAPFPLELPHRLIKMLSWKHATVLDPFSGSGTTGVACSQLERDYIGIELSEKYCELSRKRIENSIKIDIFETDKK
ncbi:MAG: site-specific DNA-methyltransferase [Clostridiales bacterium]|nr:site-specific DNA-methyltransferase [Clostridiales bacterium]